MKKITIVLLVALLVASADAQFSRRVPAGVSAATVSTMIRDSSEAQVIEQFVFGFGSGAATDTAVCTNTAYYGGFYNSTDTLEVVRFVGVMGHGIGADTVTFQVSWDDSANGASAPTSLWTTPIALNSIHKGITATVMQNAKIPPGVWVWGTTPTVVAGRKPVWLLATLSCKRIKP